MKKGIILIVLLFTFSWGTQIEGVPFVKQKTDFCGPASMSSVFAFYDLNIPQEEIGNVVYNEKLKGALITDLEDFAKKQGFKTVLKSSDMDEIKNFLDEKKPVIALVDLGFWVISKPHYIVIFGYNDEGFIAHTGYEASKLIKYGEFEKIWKRLGNTILLIYR